MNSFELYNPTKLIFGTDSYLRIRLEIPQNAKLLITYGGGSIHQNGIYEKVMEQ